MLKKLNRNCWQRNNQYEQEGSAMRTRPCLEYEGRIGHGYSNNYNYNDNNSPGAGLCAGRSRLRAAVRCGRGQAGGCSGGQLQLSRGWGGRALALPLEAMPVSWRSASLGKLQQQPWPGSEAPVTSATSYQHRWQCEHDPDCAGRWIRWSIPILTTCWLLLASVRWLLSQTHLDWGGIPDILIYAVNRMNHIPAIPQRSLRFSDRGTK